MMLQRSDGTSLFISCNYDFKEDVNTFYKLESHIYSNSDVVCMHLMDHPV